MEKTIRQQIEYYRARATEYDEWFYRIGRYDHGDELNQRWFKEAETCMRRLHSLQHVDTALELAAGTGIWTRELRKVAATVMAIDASSEVLAINREKLEHPENVVYEQADLFQWEPTRQFDLVSFTFWLSHVPPSVAVSFLSKVYRATKPGGNVWVVDSKRVSTGTAADQKIDHEGIYQQRNLNDGRAFEIVKVYYDKEKLGRLFEQVGFTVEAEETPTYFVYAAATK